MFMDELADLKRPKVEKHVWMEDVHMELVTTIDRLREVVDECIASGVYGWDLETTGLDNRVFPGPDEGRTVDSIVGHCLAPTQDRGFYVPLRHVGPDGTLLDTNLPLSAANEEFRRLADSEAIAVFHHGKFDQEFLEWGEDEPIGCWDNPDHWDDTFIMAYLRDTRDKIRGLKPLSSNELGRDMIELKELFSKEEQKRLGGSLNFSILDPSWEPCVWYACSDAMNTRGLRDLLLPVLVEQKPRTQKVIYRLEKMCLPGTRWMERCRINIDRPKVKELIALGQEEWMESLAEVYDTVSKHLNRDVRPGWFKIMQGGPDYPPTAKFNPKEMDPSYMECREEAIHLAEQLQLDPVTPDAKGKNRVQTIRKEVPHLINKRKKEQVEFPVVYDVTIPSELGLMLREIGVTGLRTTEKSGQIKTSKDEIERVIEEAGELFPFMGKIKRFRETAKALGTNLFPIWNDTAPERARDGTIRVGFNGHKVETGRFSTPQPRGKVFHGQVRWNLHSIPATYDKNKPACMLRIRECVRARKGKILFAIDYSGVELRIVTNLSREPKWMDEFFRCSGCGHTFERGNGKETPPAPPPFCPECGSDKIGDLHSLTAIAVYGDEIKDTKEFKNKRQKAKCVHPDTLVIRDGLPIRIGDLPFGDVDTFHPVGGEIQGPQGPIPLLESYNGGVKPLYHVVTRRGVVTCSDQHPFLTPDGLVSISEGLTAGIPLVDAAPTTIADGVYPTIDIPIHGDVPVLKYTPDHSMSYVAGAYQGDGCKIGNRAVSIAHGTVRKKDRLGIPYAEWQRILSGALIGAGFRPVPRKTSVYFGSRNTMAFMEFLGLLTREGHRTLRVPPWVMEAGRTAILHYLAGLWDTDGYINAKDGCGNWTTKDVVFAGQVAALLHAVGITPRVEAMWNRKYKRYYWRAHASSQGMCEIGHHMRHPGKKARLRVRTRRNRFKPNEVKLILPAGEGPCFDVHVGSEDHTFWCNGVVTRNSLNFAMCYGGGASAAQRSVGVDRDEGYRIKRQFDGTYTGLRAWWEAQHNFARKYKHVTTAFGRKYPLPDIDHENGFFRSKAERNSVNGPVQGCLHPDVRIPTSKGIFAVRDLYEQGESFMVWTGQEWKEARPLYSGEKAVRVTEFSPGTTIKTSPEHLFLTWRSQTEFPQGRGDVLEWVRQQNLAEGDWVAMSTESLEWGEPHYRWSSETRPQEGHLFSEGMTPHNYKGFSIDGNSEALWEFLGLVYGDGSIHPERFTVHVGEPDVEGYDGPSAEEIANAYADKINAALDVGAYVYRKQRPDVETHKSDLWQVKVCNKAFRDFCHDVLGVRNENTYTKRVPAALWQESIRNRAAFLRGYFSADGTASSSGDAVSVRSVNLGLLRDAHDLLRSLGIRSSCREKSLRVSVLDRTKFANMVGFTLAYKTSRLAGRKDNPWEHQWDMVPPELVRWVGETVYGSSLYADLSRAEKSAVLRLKKGSGSRHQCLKYLNKVPEKDVQEVLRELLRYDWEQVVQSTDVGETVEMYDVEVFDDFHAFVADGCVVHNTSADIMKLAIALIYKECKKRGWLGKVLMTITIHDELVFEIDEDIAEKAISVIVPLMTRTTVERLKDPIPLKVDIEFGDDWTVPNDLTVLAGNHSNNWTERWARIFPKAYQEYLSRGGTPIDGHTPDDSPDKPPKAPEQGVLNKPGVSLPETGLGKPYTHTISRENLTPDTMFKLAELIHKCEGRGTQILILQTDDGEVLWDDPEIRVSAVQFKILADEYEV